MYKQNFIFITFTILLLAGCGASDVGKVMRNEKVKTSDEFLVKKRQPLTLPPDYSKIPKPGTIEKSKEKEKIKEILKIEKENKSSSKSTKSLEDSILKKISK
jgi:hypothetical protein|tara:strand:- start:875 stop:1180 length:306 start_codon:yes stop_codon:yes gene_type:complete